MKRFHRLNLRCRANIRACPLIFAFSALRFLRLLMIHRTLTSQSKRGTEYPPSASELNCSEFEMERSRLVLTLVGTAGYYL
jgi:hypothetical protein